MIIIDIDLDFFQNGRFMYLADDEDKRLSSEQALPWREEEVISILEKNCSLSKKQKIKGKIFTHHHEVFFELRDLIKRCELQIPFELNHIDAHADLGMGEASWSYIMGELLHKPLSERSEPKQGGSDGLGFTNYLSFAIANRWIKKLNFVINEQWHDDIPRDFLVENDLPSIMPFGSYNFTIQFKKYTQTQINELSFRQKCEPIGYEPELPFSIIPYNEFKLGIPCDFLFLSQSPGYTSEATDAFIDIISEYMEPYSC
jgi:hypothetical protein